MIKIKQAVIVEGKYDKIRLSNIIDATIICTDGFRVFKNRDTADLIKALAQKCGIVILTDSDKAGQMIRKYLEKIASGGEIVSVYLPPVKGKEKRKNTPSSEGLLGVEGTEDEVIIEALKRAGVTGEKTDKKGREITKADLFALGLSGTSGANKAREELCEFLGLPTLPANSLLSVLNSLYGYDGFINEVKKWKPE